MRFSILLTISVALYFVFASTKSKSANDVIVISSQEKKLYDLINSKRKQKGLHAIPLSASLCKVAQLHALDLDQNYTQNKNCNMHSWSNSKSWTGCCYTSDHKKAACMWDKPKEISGYNSPGYEIAYFQSSGLSAESAIGSWSQSPGHANTILNTGVFRKLKWEAMGIGMHGNYAIAWFGAAKDSSKVLIRFN
jgi:uncharacterized protein YkwD